MKLNLFDKILITISGILLICAISITIKQSNSQLKNNIIYINNYQTEPLPKDIKAQAKKFNMFEELYNSDKKIVSYSIDKNTFDRKNNEIFDKKFRKKFNNENLNYQFIPYYNLEKIKQEYKIAHKKDFPDTESCGYSSLTEEELDNFIKEIEKCLINVCIIDNKKNTYTTISRDADYAIKILQELN